MADFNPENISPENGPTSLDLSVNNAEISKGRAALIACLGVASILAAAATEVALDFVSAAEASNTDGVVGYGVLGAGITYGAILVRNAARYARNHIEQARYNQGFIAIAEKEGFEP